MAISEAQEARMISQRAARNKQNAKHPFLINVKDGRLLPNVPALAGRPAEIVDGKPIPAKPGHRDYRIYTGSVKATLAERMKWLETSHMSAGGHRPVTLANVEPFDIGTATFDELIEFAQAEYGVAIDKSKGLKAARNEVNKLAEQAGAVVNQDESLG